MQNRAGIVVGADHRNGGVGFMDPRSGAYLEEEGFEVNIPGELLQNKKIYTFYGRPAEVLDQILKMTGLSLANKVTAVKYGDIIICKRSAWDDTVRKYKGTIEAILNDINTSKGCKPISNPQSTIHNPKFRKKDVEAENPNSARWLKKKNRIQELSGSISGLRAQLTRDLASDDEKTALTALVIAIMDKTAERVGNDDSADNGHFGVTGFRKKHVSVVGSRVHLEYVGKSGMAQNKSFTDERIAKALKKAIKNSPSKFLFETSDGFRIRADRVNRYLEDYKITAKDLRGYLANKWLIRKLTDASRQQPESSSEKERKKIFNKALKETALEVGHGRGTLKKHYMIPELATEFIEHGRIIDMKSMGFFREGGAVPERYQRMGFSKVGQKKRSTRPEKKWMVLARKGDQYKVVHGGQKGMQDFSQHRDKVRQRRFWNRMGGFDSEKASDPFSPLYWHKKLGTWENGGVLDTGTVKVAWLNQQDPDIMESKMYDNLETAVRESEGKTYMIMELEDQGGDYYKWHILPYGEYEKFRGLVSLNGILFEDGGVADSQNKTNITDMKSMVFSYRLREQLPDGRKVWEVTKLGKRYMEIGFYFEEDAKATAKNLNDNLKEGKITLEDGGTAELEPSNLKPETAACGCFHTYLSQNYPDLCLRLAEEDVNEVPELRGQMDEAHGSWKNNNN
jgi:hypothetical protein